MGRIDKLTNTMSGLRHIGLITIVLLSGCYKDEVDVSTMNSNPFDSGYVGPAVFGFNDTYLQTVNIGGNNVVFQVITFHVNEDLFLSPATYSVQMIDQQTGVTEVLNPDPAGSNAFKYFREPAPGQSICLELRLANNQSTAGAETICATL